MTTTNSLRRSPLWRLAAALSLLLLCGAGAPPSLALEATPAWLGGDEVAVKVMSYNIHHAVGSDGALDLRRIGQVIAASGADVVGLQEVDRHWSARSGFEDQALRLAEQLDMHYVFAANLDREPLVEGGSRRQYGTAVLSKYPIVRHENQFLTSGPSEQRGLSMATINVKGTELHLFNTHLGLSTEERKTQAAEIVEIVGDHEGPSILLGDLNAAPDTEEVRIVAARYLDAFADRSDAYTFPAAIPRIRADYIFYSDGLELASSEVIPTLASDHLPVTAVFRLQRAAPSKYGIGH